MKKNNRINIVADNTTKFLLAGRAQEKNMTLTELLIEGGLLLGRFDDGFLQQFSKMAAEMGVKDTILLQNLVLNQISLARQFQAVFGRSSGSLNRAFRWKNGKMMTGDELLAELNREYSEIFEGWKTQLIDCHDKGGAFQVSDEALEILGSAKAERELRI